VFDVRTHFISRSSLRAVALFAGLALVLTACSDSGSSSEPSTDKSGFDKSKTYVIGTSADFPPMSFLDPDNPGEFVGFEIDMMTAMMGHLGVEFEWRAMKFDGLLPAVQAGQVDMVVSDVYDTAERQAVVDFVDYIQSGLAVMVLETNAGSIESYADLCGKSMGILVGSPFEQEVADKANADCAAAGEPAIDVQSFQAVADELPQVDNGRLTAILEDVVSLGYIGENSSGKYTIAFIDPGQTRSGIVLEKGSPLAAGLSEAFQWYKDSGQYKTDTEKWGIIDSSLI
jgi:polar amino acid transport system substrate-binding protein